MAKQRLGWVLGAALIGALGTLGCESLTGLDEFQLQSSLGDAGIGNCTDPSGFEGRGCYSCAPTVGWGIGAPPEQE